MTPTPVIAVLDAGKTNKKIFLFNQSYEIVFEHTTRIPDTVDEDGDPCDDVHAITRWVLESIERVVTLPAFDVKAFNFTSFGASLVHVNEDGKPILPLYSYLKPFPDELKREFFTRYGGEEQMSRETASPVLDSLNSGLMLYRLKHRHAITDKKGYSLHVPQYLSYLASGRFYSDITSIGCHTMLWDFPGNGYHRWVVEEGVINRLADIFPSDGVVPVLPSWGNRICGIGLHDSSSALIPYLAAFQQPFVLISTGTWCISLNPFNDLPLTDDELRRDCLSFISYKGRPVKASRLFAGKDHELQAERIARHFDLSSDQFTGIGWSSATVLSLRKKMKQDQRKQFESGSSLFAERNLNDFDDVEEAYHQLMLDIVAQQILSTRLLMNSKGITRIFVDGGFSRNAIYMNLLAQEFQGIEVYAATVAQATAMGAALAIHEHWNDQDIPSDLIHLNYYAPPQLVSDTV